MTPSIVGSCTLTRVITRFGRDRVRVDRADPVVVITAQLLAELRAGNHARGVRLAGDVLTIRGTNRTVRYRLGGTAGVADRYAVLDGVVPR